LSEVQADLEASQEDALTDLLARAAAGDDLAWTQLVNLYARRLFALARSRLGSVDLAEEIVQSVLVTVATKVTAGEYTESGRFEPWLFRVAMNRIRDEIRRQRRSIVETNGHLPEQAGPVETLVGDDDDDGQQMDALRAALGRLPDVDREVIELRHHGSMSFKEIAAMTGEPMGTLLARHHRALRKLRAMIEKYLADQKIERTR